MHLVPSGMQMGVEECRRLCYRFRLTAVGLLLDLLFGIAVAASYPLEIIELKSRQAEEVLPLIQPFVGPDGAVSGARSQLFIRAEPGRLEQIRAMVEHLDRPPRKLMILVRRGRLSEQDLEYAAAAIHLVTDDVRVVAGGRAPEDSVGVAVDRRSSRRTLDADQRVQTVEGYPAHIAVGAQVPLRYSGGYPGASYRRVDSGFTVVPRLNGDRVTLEISAGDDRLRRGGGVVDTRRVSTQVQGRIGEWIALGGVSETRSRTESGLAYRSDSSAESSSEIYLLVEEIP